MKLSWMGTIQTNGAISIFKSIETFGWRKRGKTLQEAISSGFKANLRVRSLFQSKVQILLDVFDT